MTSKVTAPAQESLDRLTRALTGRGGVSHAEHDLIARRIGQAVLQEIGQWWRGKDAPGLSVQLIEQTASHGQAPDGYREVADRPVGVTVQITASQPKHVELPSRFHVWPAETQSAPAEFEVSRDGHPDRLMIFLRDVHPRSTHVFEHKLRSWVDVRLTEILQELAAAVETSLEGSQDSAAEDANGQA